MGTVLHREIEDFLIGDIRVSVPFSMGTVLHLLHVYVAVEHRVRFSPLLDGDGVASPSSIARLNTAFSFQSPSRWGRCCIMPQAAPV